MRKRERERTKRSSIGNCCKIRGCEIRRESLLPRVFLTFASTSKRSKRVARTDPRQFSGTNFSKRFGKRSSLSRVFPSSGRCVESCNYFFERFLQETSFNTPQRDPFRVRIYLRIKVSRVVALSIFRQVDTASRATMTLGYFPQGIPDPFL